MLLTRRLLILILVGSSFLSACSRNAEVSALCRRSPELESSLVAVNENLANLGAASSGITQSSLAVLLDTLGVMLELPPREARENLEKVERAYREVSIALRNVYWDLSLAVNDMNVLLSLENLSREDNVRALNDLERVIERLCAKSLDAEAPLFDGNSTTLPPPQVVVEPLEEYEYLFDDEPSAMASYGFLIASGRGVTLTPEQAVCVGSRVTEAAQSAILDDNQFESAVSEALSACSTSSSVATITVDE